ncbi:hypothetical protein HID58_075520, partial [Brassica napus]
INHSFNDSKPSSRRCISTYKKILGSHMAVSTYSLSILKFPV